MALESLGKMGDLLQDHSPIQLNTRGSYKGGQFVVVGRVQYQYAEGVWNEWHILFSNGKSGWMSEASGSFVISFPVASHKVQADYSDFSTDQTLLLVGQTFRVVAIESAKLVAAEGEIPFKFEPNANTVIIDLSNEHSFASLDYSERPPKLYLGEHVELAQLALKHLKENAYLSANTKVKSLQCPACAASIEVSLDSTQSMTCKSCTAVLDVSHPQAQIIQKYQVATHVKPTLPLGIEGEFETVKFRVIGFIRRQVVDSVYQSIWDEYLLHHPLKGFRWLTCSRGHWNYLTPMQKSPSVQSYWGGTPDQVTYLKKYKHFERYHAKVIYVLGEFYWRVVFDQRAELNDYIAPPSMLSHERTGKESLWTQCEYVYAEELQSAFQLIHPLKEPVGIHANQPSPYAVEAMDFLQTWIGFLLIGLVIQLGFVFFASSRVLLDTSVSFENDWGSSEFTSEPFTVEGHPSNLLIRQQASLNNSWLATDISLIERTTGKRYESGREMSYYSGWDSDGSWSEDQRDSEIVFSQIPAGDYILIIKPYRDAVQTNGISDRVTVYRDVPVWSNLWLLWGVLTIIPAIFYYMSRRFEVKRWESSDHPIITS